MIQIWDNGSCTIYYHVIEADAQTGCGILWATWHVTCSLFCLSKHKAWLMFSLLPSQSQRGTLLTCVCFKDNDKSWVFWGELEHIHLTAIGLWERGVVSVWMSWMLKPLNVTALCWCSLASPLSIWVCRVKLTSNLIHSGMWTVCHLTVVYVPHVVGVGLGLSWHWAGCLHTDAECANTETVPVRASEGAFRYQLAVEGGGGRRR